MPSKTQILGTKDARLGLSFVPGSKVRALFGEWAAEERFGERELVEYAIRFLNGETVPSRPPAAAELRAFWQAVEEPAASPDEKKAAFALLMPLFTAVASNRRQAAERYLQAIQGLVTSLKPRLLLTGTPARPALECHLDVDDVRTLYTFVALLLLDESRGIELRRCELQTCHRFFVVRRARGRPQNRFCHKDHMKTAHNLEGADRMRKLRAKRMRSVRRHK